MPSPHDSGIRCQVHRKYKLTCEDYDSLWVRSGGVCEICHSDERLVIDHDHKYGNGAVRGLVCNRCNQLIAMLEDLRPFPAVLLKLPDDWFRLYCARAWFTKELRTVEPPKPGPVMRTRMAYNIDYYERARRSVMLTNPTDLLVPLCSPTKLAEVLRQHMSPQGFAILVKVLNKLREKPKQS